MKQKVALALGSGGARCLTHVVIEVPDKQNQGYLTLMQLTSSMMVFRISNLLLELSNPDILINIPASSAKTFEFHKASKLIKIGEEIANQEISNFHCQ